MKKGRLFLLFFTLPLLSLSGQTSQGRDAAFGWSLFLLNRREPAPLSLERPVKLQTGDRISFTLKSEADCFVYVIVRDAENAVAVLHNSPLGKGETLDLGPILLTLPAGRETVFFVVSSREIPALRRALGAWRANPGSARAGRDLLDAVYGLRRDISQLRENLEQPLAMGGAVRDTGEAPAGLLFSGAGTYVKTIVLEH
jgi:hypothetical protein